MTFGGGPASIALIQNEVIKYNWFSVEEFTNVLAISNSLPGPIATKLAAIVGYKTAGVIGAVLAILATVVPTAIAVIVLLNVYNRYKNEAWLKGMLRAVKPVIVVMIAHSAFTLFMGNKDKDIVFLVISVVAAAGLYFNLNPVYLILGSFAAGFLIYR